MKHYFAVFVYPAVSSSDTSDSTLVIRRTNRKEYAIVNLTLQSDVLDFSENVDTEEVCLHLVYSHERLNTQGILDIYFI